MQLLLLPQLAQKLFHTVVVEVVVVVVAYKRRLVVALVSALASPDDDDDDGGVTNTLLRPKAKIVQATHPNRAICEEPIRIPTTHTAMTAKTVGAIPTTG